MTFEIENLQNFMFYAEQPNQKNSIEVFYFIETWKQLIKI